MTFSIICVDIILYIYTNYMYLKNIYINILLVNYFQMTNVFIELIFI